MVNLPVRSRTWSQELSRRIGFVLLLLLVNIAIVYLDRDAYIDITGEPGVSLIDAIYYTTVTITTTGYGDLVPVAEHARLLNALIVTPLRIVFLVLLVGTTLEVLASQGRKALLDSRWRKRMNDHTVVIGYGTMGHRAIQTLIDAGVHPSKILVIDALKELAESANAHGLASFVGDATNRDLLRRAEIAKAREVIITTGRDDAAILATLTVRQLNPTAHLVVAVRQQDNVELALQSGASDVVTSSESVGRLVGLSSLNPNLSLVVEDLLSHGDGLDVCQRPVAADEVGVGPCDITTEPVLAVLRDGVLRRYSDPEVEKLQVGDDLIVVRDTTGGSCGSVLGTCGATASTAPDVLPGRP